MSLTEYLDLQMGIYFKSELSFGQGYCNLPKKCQVRVQHLRRKQYRLGFRSY